MARFDMSDREWSIINPLLPTNTRGMARVDDRKVINGIFLNVMARIRPFIIGLSGGESQVSLTAYCKLFQWLMTEKSK